MNKVAKLPSYPRKYLQVVRDILKSLCYQQKNTSNIDTLMYSLTIHILLQFTFIFILFLQSLYVHKSYVFKNLI